MITLGNGHYPKYRYRVTEVEGWLSEELEVGQVFVSDDKGEENTWFITNNAGVEGTVTGVRLGIFVGRTK